MNHKVKFGIAILVLYPVLAMAEVVEYESAWGENCYPSKDSYAVKLKNQTGKAVDFKLCLERTNGKWSCYVSSNVSPGEVNPSSWGYSVCHGTGNSKWWWRDAGNYSTKFPKI